MWNTLVNINSLLWVFAAIYGVYSVGASIYFLTAAPLAFAIILLFILTITEFIFGALEG